MLYSAANWLEVINGAAFKTFCLCRVISCHGLNSNSRQSDTTAAHQSPTHPVSSANRRSSSGPDQQQQQQKRDFYWRPAQTGRWLDKGDCSSSSPSAPPLPKPDQTAETAAGPGWQRPTQGSSHTWGIGHGDVCSGREEIWDQSLSCAKIHSIWCNYEPLSAPFVPLFNFLLFQMKCAVGPNNVQLPLSCPLTAALGPSMPATLGSSAPALLAPGYLLPAGPYGGMAPGPLYPQQWPSIPSPVGSVSPVGQFGAAGMMPYATIVNPGIQAYPLIVHNPESNPCPKTTRTT